jgi:DnaJ-class molecular chaperone
MRDPYEVLGVARAASQDDIKKAYRKLAKQLHPDRNQGDAKIAERFKEVSAAYSVVGDEDNRKRFDRGEIDSGGNERPQGFSAGGPWGRGGPRGQRRPEGAEEAGFGEDIFETLFRGGRRGHNQGPFGFAGKQKGADRRYALNVDFIAAARGAKRRINLPDGKALDVAIPAGIQSGQQIRLKGQGDPSPNGGETGDALIEVSVEPHPFFERKGADIHLEIPVTLGEAVLGGRIAVPTVDGMVNVNVPRNASSGTTLRLKGKGISTRGAEPGDQYVRLRLVLPPGGSPELEKLVADWPDGTDIRGGYRAEQG